jgi:hypothetical protein
MCFSDLRDESAVGHMESFRGISVIPRLAVRDQHA